MSADPAAIRKLRPVAGPAYARIARADMQFAARICTEGMVQFEDGLR